MSDAYVRGYVDVFTLTTVLLNGSSSTYFIGLSLKSTKMLDFKEAFNRMKLICFVVNNVIILGQWLGIITVAFGDQQWKICAF